MKTRTSIFVDFFDIKAISYYLLVASLLLTTILFGSNSIICRDTIVMDCDAIEVRSGRMSLDYVSIPESEQTFGGRAVVFNRVKI